MNEPTPEQALAALRAVDEGRERVIRSAIGSRWTWLATGLGVFLYCAANDLFPAARGWLGLALLAYTLVLIVGMRTRMGAALFGRSVGVSNRSLAVPVRRRLLGVAPILGIGIVAVVLIAVFHLPHGQIYYGALVGLYVIFLGPRFQLWLLHRQNKQGKD